VPRSYALVCGLHLVRCDCFVVSPTTGPVKGRGRSRSVYPIAADVAWVVVERFPHDVPVFRLRESCRDLSNHASICRVAAQRGLLCSAARLGTASLGSILRALRPVQASLLDRVSRHGPRVSGCATAWALQAGHGDAVRTLSELRVAIDTPPATACLGTVRDLLAWGWGEYCLQTTSEGDGLAWSARGGQLELYDSFSAAGQSPSSHGASSLHWACECGHESMIHRILADARFDDAAGARVGSSAVSEALMTACAARRADIVRLLLKDARTTFDARLPASCISLLLRDDAVICLGDEPYPRIRDRDEVFLRLGDFIGSCHRIRVTGDTWHDFGMCALVIAASVGAAEVVDAILEDRRVRATNSDFSIIMACIAGHSSIAERLIDFFYPSDSVQVCSHPHVDRVMGPSLHAHVFFAACIGGSASLIRRVVGHGGGLQLAVGHGGGLQLATSDHHRTRSLGMAGVGLAALCFNSGVLSWLLSNDALLDECSLFQLAPGRGFLECLRAGTMELSIQTPRTRTVRDYLIQHWVRM